MALLCDMVYDKCLKIFNILFHTFFVLNLLFVQLCVKILREWQTV